MGTSVLAANWLRGPIGTAPVVPDSVTDPALWAPSVRLTVTSLWDTCRSPDPLIGVLLNQSRSMARAVQIE